MTSRAGGPDRTSCWAGSGLDQLDGGGGSDRIYGGMHDDTLVGGPGTDVLQGGRGADDAAGGDGDDILRLRAGDSDAAVTDRVDGGEGIDTIQLNGFPAGVCPETGDGAARCGSELVDSESGGTFAVFGIEAVRHEHVTTSIGDGANARAILVNPTGRSVEAQLELFASDGAALARAGVAADNADAVDGGSAPESSALTVPAYARLAVDLPATMPGSSVTLRVEADERLIVVLQQGEGSAAREAPVADAFYLPFADPRDTTLQVVKGSVGGTVKVDHLRSGGGEVNSYEVRVGAHGHVLLPMAEMFPDASAEGILRIEGGELGAAGRIEDVERGAGYLTAMPASIDFSTGNSGPALAGGERYIGGLLSRSGGTADIVVFNPGAAEAKGELGFHDGAGRPATVALEGRGSVTTVPVELGGGGVMTVRALDPVADVYAVLRIEEGAADAVLGRSRADSYLTTRAQRPGAGRVFAILGPTEAGRVELRIVAAEQASVTLQLRDADGSLVAGGQRTVDLGAGAAVSGHAGSSLPEPRHGGARRQSSRRDVARHDCRDGSDRDGCGGTRVAICTAFARQAQERLGRSRR